MSRDFELGGETLRLDPRRALLWPRAATLLVADLHLGKDASLRRRGFPVPAAPDEEDLARLAALVAEHRCERLVILGDLAHAPARGAEGWIAAWIDFRRRHRELAVALVPGNHDRGLDAAGLGIERLEEGACLGPLRLAHAPDSVTGPSLAGHLHPAVRLAAPGLPAARLPCLWLRAAQAVLPAFGTLTGAHLVRLAPGERALVCAAGAVLECPQSRRPRTALR